ncbi:MAG: hypothetical protein EZS28_038392 [Streblomastix strix]|uniref:Protein kinase domain-containing protein n=1 Tax=Streblomastix strix TaxID=222440 RepID=A0A5J4U852_9EUKA|nr:MAG: hypothetical protein EZS28_038392 [Streblomastix strix]
MEKITGVHEQREWLDLFKKFCDEFEKSNYPFGIRKESAECLGGSGTCQVAFVANQNERPFVVKICEKDPNKNITSELVDKYRKLYSANPNALLNVLIPRTIIEKPDYIFFERQFIPQSMKQRMHEYPPLLQIEKKWLSFQLLMAVKQLHDQQLAHGNIRPSNILFMSNDWLLLSDPIFARPNRIVIV